MVTLPRVGFGKFVDVRISTHDTFLKYISIPVCKR